MKYISIDMSLDEITPKRLVTVFPEAVTPGSLTGLMGVL